MSTFDPDSDPSSPGFGGAPDNSWTEVFTPAGAIRSENSTADAGTAHTVIRYGSESDFQAACQRLAA